MSATAPINPGLVLDTFTMVAGSMALFAALGVQTVRLLRVAIAERRKQEYARDRQSNHWLTLALTVIVGLLVLPLGMVIAVSKLRTWAADLYAHGDLYGHFSTTTTAYDPALQLISYQLTMTATAVGLYLGSLYLIRTGGELATKAAIDGYRISTKLRWDRANR